MMKFAFSESESTRFVKRFMLLLALMTALLASPAILAQEDEEEFVQEGFEVPETRDSESDPVKLFQEAQQAHEAGDIEKALELYGKAIAAYPEFPEAEYQRATIYQSRGNWVEAENSFRKAVEYRPDWTLAMAALGSILIQNDKLAEAGIVLEKAIRLDGMNFPAYVAMTDLYLIEPPDVTKIRGLYSRLVYLTTKAKVSASIWACRGSMERVLGQLNEAGTSIGRALEIQPDNNRARVEEIELALARSDFKVAVGLARKLSTEDSENAGAKMLLARGLALSGQPESAIEVLETIVDPTPRVQELLSSIKSAGNVDVAALEKELEKNPESVPALSQLCWAMRVDDPAKALKYCENAYRLERDNITHAVGFGAALVQMQEYGRAIKLLEEIKIRVPENYTVRANLATAYFGVRDFEKAKTEYLWITETQPGLAAGYYFLAISYDNLTEYMDALANYQQFVRLADQTQFEAELDRVRLRMPILQRQIREGAGKKRGRQ